MTLKQTALSTNGMLEGGCRGGDSWSIHVELNRSQNTEKQQILWNERRRQRKAVICTIRRKFVCVDYVRRCSRSKTLDDLTLVLLICLFSAGLIDQQESLWLWIFTLHRKSFVCQAKHFLGQIFFVSRRWQMLRRLSVNSLSSPCDFYITCLWRRLTGQRGCSGICALASRDRPRVCGRIFNEDKKAKAPLKGRIFRAGRASAVKRNVALLHIRVGVHIMKCIVSLWNDKVSGMVLQKVVRYKEMTQDLSSELSWKKKEKSSESACKVKAWILLPFFMLTSCLLLNQVFFWLIFFFFLAYYLFMQRLGLSRYHVNKTSLSDGHRTPSLVWLNFINIPVVWLKKHLSLATGRMGWAAGISL